MNNPTQFYSWRQAILKSGLQATTRHVLLTLSCHMNDAGESCYPSIELLCEETGLSNRSVITHLKVAEEGGWIVVDKHGFSGQKWARNEYRIAWPNSPTEPKGEPPKAVNDVHHLGEGKVVKEVHHLQGEGSEPNDKKAVKEVHTNYPVELSILPTSVGSECAEQTKQPRRPAKVEVELIEGRFKIADHVYDRWKETYPDINLEQELGKAEAWLDANPKRMPKKLKPFMVNWLSRAQSDVTKYLAARSRPKHSSQSAQSSRGSFQPSSHTGNSDPVRSLVSGRR